jgi:hypothetical protein
MNRSLYCPCDCPIVGKSHFGLGRMHVDVHKFWFYRDPDHCQWVPTDHQQRVKTLFDDEVQRSVLYEATIDEEVHLLAMGSGYARARNPTARGDARHSRRLIEFGKFENCMPHIRTKDRRGGTVH